SRTIGMVLMNHGIFSFGETAHESYERMIALVTRAEEYLAKCGAWELPVSPVQATETPRRHEIAELRKAVSRAAGFPLLLAVHDDAHGLAFCRRDDVAELSQQGPATPDHVIRTKRVPLIGRDVEGYVDAYRRMFEERASSARAPKTML